MRSTTSPPPPRRRLVALGTAVVLTASGLAAATATAGSASADPVRAASPATKSGPAYLDARQPTARRVADLLSRMTLDEKIGQMTQAERGGIDADPTQITTLGLGSVLSGGGSVPTPNTPKAWADMVDRYQRGRDGDPARHPADLRRRLRARPRQPAGRHRLPAQHRPGRHP